MRVMRTKPIDDVLAAGEQTGAVSAVHPRFGTPMRLTVGITLVVALIAGFVPLTELADLVSIGALFAFVLVSVAVPVLRRTRPDLHRPFRVPLSPVLALAAALAGLVLMADLGFYGRRHARLAQPVDKS